MSKDRNSELFGVLILTLGRDTECFTLSFSRSEKESLSPWCIKKINLENESEKSSIQYPKIKVLSNGYKFRSY